jgi:hypothetical protein
MLDHRRKGRLGSDGDRVDADVSVRVVQGVCARGRERFQIFNS